MKYEHEIKEAVCDIITKYCDKSNEKIMFKLAEISSQLSFDNKKLPKRKRR